MGCNCKTKSVDVDVLDTEGLFQKVVKNIIKVFGFLISLVLVPFFMVVVIWYMFDMIVLNQNVDLRKILTYVMDKAKHLTENKDDEDDDDDDYNDLTEDDVILLDADEITDKRN